MDGFVEAVVQAAQNGDIRVLLTLALIVSVGLLTRVIFTDTKKDDAITTTLEFQQNFIKEFMQSSTREVALLKTSVEKLEEDKERLSSNVRDLEEAKKEERRINQQKLSNAHDRMRSLEKSQSILLEKVGVDKAEAKESIKKLEEKLEVCLQDMSIREKQLVDFKHLFLVYKKRGILNNVTDDGIAELVDRINGYI